MAAWTCSRRRSQTLYALAQSLRANGLRFRAWDYTAADYQHAQLKEQVTEELRAEFEAEGNMFLYSNRHGEAEGYHLKKEGNASILLALGPSR